MERQLAGMTLLYGDDGEIAEGASSSRSWAEMAPDVLAHIFRCLSLRQLLTIIPCVCKPWQRASLNPLCYQTLHLEWSFNWDSLRKHSRGGLLEVLLARSQGCLVEISWPPFIGLEGLYLIARSAPLLQKLHIPESLADNEWASYAAPLMPHIVDLDVSMCDESLSHEAIAAFGKSCKHMRCLRRNRVHMRSLHMLGDEDCPSSSSDDSEAVAIAQYYPCLEHLELQCNPLSNKGLQAILDSCPLLEYLDLTGCEHLQPDVDSSLFDRCRAQVKVFIDKCQEDSDQDDPYDGAYDECLWRADDGWWNKYFCSDEYLDFDKH